jgi:hypothetical protein
MKKRFPLFNGFYVPALNNSTISTKMVFRNTKAVVRQCMKITRRRQENKSSKPAPTLHFSPLSFQSVNPTFHPFFSPDDVKTALNQPPIR